MYDLTILKSAKLSLIIQIITCIILFIGLIIPIKKHLILKEILYIELIVQIVEITFYFWLIYNFTSLEYDITYVRYFDWVISTPFMLLIIIFFMEYITNNNVRAIDIIINDYFQLLLIILSNFFMLLFGFLGEIKYLNKYISITFGFIFFIFTYYLIIKYYLKNNLFNFFIILINVIIWSIYGIAFNFSFTIKNNMYNILDIFSKNITAIFIFIYTLMFYL